MQKLFALLAILALVFAACDEEPDQTVTPLSYISARTSEPVTLDAGEQNFFTFTDNTVVVNLETNNAGTLGDLN